MLLESSLNHWGVGVVIYLQKFPILGVSWVDKFWQLITKFGDPKMVFTLYFPFMFPFSKHTAQEFFIAGAVSEFLNMTFKWILMSDRPYWWIHDSGYYSNTTIPKVDQFEHTCETGPGSPSGHAMVTACVWYVFLMNFTRKINSTFKVYSWMAYVSVLFFIALSRLYVAAHFPHQLVLGIGVGLILGRIIFKHCKTVSFAELFVAVCVLAFLASIVLLVAYFSRHDLNWSIALAVKYCKNRAWIHVSTTPFTAFYRDLGALLGLGLAVDSRNYYGIKNHDIKPSNRFVLASLNLVLSMISNHLLDHVKNLYLFYACCFMYNFSLPFFTAFILPFCVIRFVEHSKND